MVFDRVAIWGWGEGGCGGLLYRSVDIEVGVDGGRSVASGRGRLGGLQVSSRRCYGESSEASCARSASIVHEL